MREARARNVLTRQPEFLRVMQLATSSDFVFTADRFAVDDASGKVKDLVDWLDPTHLIRQTTSGNQCALPAADATLAGARSLTVTTANSYYSTRAASTYKNMHDGTGFTLIHVAKPTASVAGQYVSETTNGGTGPGCGFGFGTTGNILHRVRDAGGTAICQSGAAGVSHNAWNAIRCDYLEGAATEFHVLVNGTQIASGNSSGAPSSANPYQGIRLFSSFTGSWHATLGFARVLTAAEVSVISSWVYSLGIAAA